jgi:hypothetical protein
MMMPFFFLALLFCLAQAQDDLLIPLKSNAQYIKTGMALRSSRTEEEEITAARAMLESKLSCATAHDWT